MPALSLRHRAILEGTKCGGAVNSAMATYLHVVPWNSSRSIKIVAREDVVRAAWMRASIYGDAQCMVQHAAQLEVK